MLFNSILSTTLISLASIAKLTTAADLPAIEIGGNKFFFSNNGSQFFMKGIAYQSDNSNSTDLLFVDPLADEESCARDIPYLQELNTNVIRVYAVNASLDHDPCMKLLNDAGIYVIADLSEPGLSIITDDPSWNLELYDRYTQVIDMFSNYTNVLGFFAGNEVITDSSNTDAAPFIKAAVRDMKQYIDDQGYRKIPVGYSANDDSETRIRSADYFACGEEDIKADFYGINMYSWCGDSDFETSGYADRTKEFSNLTIPVFFSEYGCNRVQPRKFTEVQALYGPNMTDVWSGGIVYMYFQETNDYGLVTVSGNSVSTLADFNYLKSELGSITPSSATYASATATETDLACPNTDRFWAAVTSLPPSPDKSICDCVYQSLECVVSEDIDETDYADLFSYVCNEIECHDINANGTTGDFGEYSFCSPKEKLSYILNQYYLDQDSSNSACDFDGSATLKSTTNRSSCSSILSGLTRTGSASNSSSTSDSGDDDDSSSSSSSSRSRSTSSSDSSSSSTASSSSTSSSSAGNSLKPSTGTSELLALAVAISCVAGGFSFLFI